MLVGRLNLFRCDTCQLEAYSSTFPDGWHWTKGGMDKPTGHCCGTCSESIPDNVKGRAGQKYPINDNRNGHFR